MQAQAKEAYSSRRKHKHKMTGKRISNLAVFDAYAYVYVEAVTIEARLGSQLCLCRKS